MSDRKDGVRVMLLTIPDHAEELTKTMDDLAAKHGIPMTDLALKIHNARMLHQMMLRHGALAEIVDVMSGFIGGLLSEFADMQKLDAAKATEIAIGVNEHMVTLRQELLEKMGNEVSVDGVGDTLKGIFNQEKKQ